VTNRHKAKGTRWETDVVRFLAGLGLSTHRNAQHGSNDIGDIGGLELFAIECKDHRTHALAEWLDQAVREAANAGKPYGVVVFKRARKPVGDAYVLMDLKTFAALVIILERTP
jgi:hypothetical protein